MISDPYIMAVFRAQRGATLAQLRKILDECENLERELPRLRGDRLFDRDGYRLIEYAVHISSTLLLRELLDRGADVDRIGESYAKDRPVTIALRNFDAACLRCLLEYGADVSYLSPCVLNVVVFTSYQHLEILTLMIAAGADFNSYTARLMESRLNVAKHMHALDGGRALRILLASGFSDSVLSHDEQFSASVQNTLDVASAGDPARIFATEHRLVSKARFSLFSRRATVICTALQSMCIDANRLCEIVMAACGTPARDIPFYFVWRLVTTVKHFQTKEKACAGI